ncbi:hypothetical protein [[Clostridium] colinum]|uniref:hypothetical protein n=1 Tax=[Clostridium] colinum TaxID=36835 RepID=UPI00202415C8|nr:hypothetical protein [[Clostridium] colinum]
MSSKYLNKKNQVNKIKMYIICIFCILFFIVNSIYEIKNYNHICVGDKCPICTNVKKIEILIKQFFITPISISIIVLLLMNFLIKNITYINNQIVLTPIKLKVRMNN